MVNASKYLKIHFQTMIQRRQTALKLLDEYINAQPFDKYDVIIQMVYINKLDYALLHDQNLTDKEKEEIFNAHKPKNLS